MKKPEKENEKEAANKKVKNRNNRGKKGISENYFHRKMVVTTKIRTGVSFPSIEFPPPSLPLSGGHLTSSHLRKENLETKNQSPFLTSLLSPPLPPRSMLLVQVSLRKRKHTSKIQTFCKGKKKGLLGSV